MKWLTRPAVATAVAVALLLAARAVAPATVAALCGPLPGVVLDGLPEVAGPSGSKSSEPLLPPWLVPKSE